MAHSQAAARADSSPNDSRSYWFIFALSYFVFLAIAFFGAAVGAQWRSWLPGAEGVKSVFGGVKAAVYTFMSHLT